MGIAAIKWKPNFGNESFASIAISKKYCLMPHFISFASIDASAQILLCNPYRMGGKKNINKPGEKRRG